MKSRSKYYFGLLFMKMYLFDIILFASKCTVVLLQTREMSKEKMHCKIMWQSLFKG